ncbi:hypothetical protein C0J52_05370, partial [Blattella germanica]
ILPSRPLHDERLGVWCVVNKYRIIGPIYYGTINGQRYRNNIMKPFFEELTDIHCRSGFFHKNLQQRISTHYSLLGKHFEDHKPTHVRGRIDLITEQQLMNVSFVSRCRKFVEVGHFQHIVIRYVKFIVMHEQTERY